jgi:DNA modification methylase
MPNLHWNSKSLPEPIPTTLITEGVIFPQGKGYPDARAKDRLILGDNLAVMSALLPEFEGQIDLIYADPPFFSNRRYSARVGRGEDSRQPKEWQLAEGYQDHWPDLESYLDMLYPRLVLMHRLLSSTGTLYLHLDWHANAYARVLLDEIFGSNRLLNEIVWVYHGPSPIRSAFNRKHDTILAYTKTPKYKFNVDDVRQPYDPSTVKTFASSSKAGFGKVPDLKRGKVPEDWWYFPVVARLHSERTGYPTQKPESLLERIILASSDQDDLMADFFCGAGTAAVVAARLGRRYIVSDLQNRAVQTTRARLVKKGAAPFNLQVEEKVVVHQATSCQGTSFAEWIDPTTVGLKSEFVPETDYWEVDPDWDGKIFRSAFQAVRPLRKGELPTELELPSPGKKVCVRMVKITGEQLQFVSTGP